MSPNRRNFLVTTAAATLALGGCASPDVGDYAAERPALVLERYFDGRVDAWGMFTDRSGRVVKRFTVVLDAKWQGAEGTLDEEFSYSDGTRQHRTWHIRKLGDGRYTGRADDVVGQAQGQARGNALRWNYTLALPVDGRTWHVAMDDWMFQVNEQVLMNRTTMTKFGFRLGEVTIAFRKQP
jgi:hypothetical protein